MRIGIEIGWGNRTGGARTVSRKLVAAMAELEPTWRFVVLSNTQQPGLERANIEQHVLPVPHESLYDLYNHIVFPHFQIPRFFSREPVDCVHYTNSIISFRRPFRTVLNLHDLSPFRAPSSWSFFLRQYMKFHLKILAPRADIIITSSASSEADIRQILGISAEKIRVIPHAVGDEFAPIDDRGMLEEVRERLCLPRRFILFIGTIQPRKNLGRLIAAYARLRGNRGMEHGLVIIGRKGWGKINIGHLAREMQIDDRVVYIENAQQGDLPAIYSMADLFVYPTLYEGFGIPPLEAMACGTPVAASKTSSIPEVVGDAAILFDPEDVEDISRAVDEALSDSAVRESLVRRGFEQVKRYNWKRSARQALELYKELCNV